MNTKISFAKVQYQRLTDGSYVYSVELTAPDGTRMSLACIGAQEAVDLLTMLEHSVSYVEPLQHWPDAPAARAQRDAAVN